MTTAVPSPVPSTARTHRPSRPGRSRAFTLGLALVVLALLACFGVTPAASAATGDFVITGRGWGHGEGMSQWGMWQAARGGNTYQKILAFYYPGSTLTQVSAVSPTRQTVGIRITTSADSFAKVQLTASVTGATLVDFAGATIRTLGPTESVTLLNYGGKVRVDGADATYAYVELRPIDASGRVTVAPSDGLWAKGPRQYWGSIRVLPNVGSSTVYVVNFVDVDHFAAGVSEIMPEWAIPTNNTYYAPDAVKAQIVAARSYTVARSGFMWDDSRDMTYVGWNLEKTYPYLTQASRETAGEVLTYAGKVISAHFSTSSGGYTTNSAWGTRPPYEPAQPDPWSLAAPPTIPGYAWSITVSPAALATALSSLNVGTITRVDVTERDTADSNSHARTLAVTGSSATKTIAATDFKARLGLKSTLILSIVREGAPPPPPVTRTYQETRSEPLFVGPWVNQASSSASGGSYRYLNAPGSCTVKFTGTSVVWYGKKKATYGLAKVTLDGVSKGVVDLYSATELYKQVCWRSGTLPAGQHTLSIAWTGSKNSRASGCNVAVDAFQTVGTIQPVCTRVQQDDGRLGYSGTWSRFLVAGASGGSYARTSLGKSSVTITFKGAYLGWIATKGTTLGKAFVSVDGGAAKSVNLAAPAVAYQQKVWATGMLKTGLHTVKIWRDTSSATGKYISLDAVEVWGTLQ